MNDLSPITDLEFSHFQRLIYDIAGISLSPAKRALVSGRLSRRIRELNLTNYSEYLALLSRKEEHAELQMAVDLLTTNETFFFREEKHFAFLKQYLRTLRHTGATFRVWSAACSTGEEPYSIAMVLAETLGEQRSWEVIGSDISKRVLEKAASGCYPLGRADAIPTEYLYRYCLKGIGSQKETFRIDAPLRNRVHFMQINLNAPISNIGEFDVIFLRNVMIYFDATTKSEVVERVSSRLKPEGYLIVSHSESLQGVRCSLRSVAPSIYKKT